MALLPPPKGSGRSAYIDFMKLKALNKISHREKDGTVITYEKGDVFDLDDKKAERLIKIGAAQKIVYIENYRPISVNFIINEEVREKINTVKSKDELIKIGEELGMKELKKEMKMDELKEHILNFIDEKIDREG